MIIDSPGQASFNIEEYQQLLAGNIERVAPKQIDNFQDVNFNETLEGYRLSFEYNEELEENVLHVIDNSTNTTVKRVPSQAKAEQTLRIRRLAGLIVDERG